MALAALAFPIRVVSAQEKPKQLVFRIDPELRERQSKPLPVLGPFPSEIKKENKKEPLPKKAAAPKQEKKPFDPCNCVSYVKYRRNGNIPVGYGFAKNFPVNSQVPQIGAVIITYESFKGTSTGHAGIVIGVNENKVVIDDYNYKPCKNTIRELPLDSPLIKGYII